MLNQETLPNTMRGCEIGPINVIEFNFRRKLGVV